MNATTSPALLSVLIVAFIGSSAGCSEEKAEAPGASGGAPSGGGTCAPFSAVSDGTLTVLRQDVGARRLGALGGEQMIRIAHDPATGAVYTMNRFGQFWQVD